MEREIPWYSVWTIKETELASTGTEKVIGGTKAVEVGAGV